MANRCALLLLFCALVYAGTTVALPDIESKCTACRAITKELRRRLDSEKPRNHLDMRHRLDPQGKRYGRVIDYKISELRAVELLENLCGELRAYSLVTFIISSSAKATRQWTRVNNPDADPLVNGTRPQQHIEAVQQRQLQFYCGAVMADHEEELEEAITGGKFEESGVIDDFLCSKSIKACPDGTLPAAWIEDLAADPAAAGSGGDEAQASPAGSQEKWKDDL